MKIIPSEYTAMHTLTYHDFCPKCFDDVHTRTFWPFTRGEHRIEARDSDDKTDSVKIVVR